MLTLSGHQGESIIISISKNVDPNMTISEFFSNKPISSAYQ